MSTQNVRDDTFFVQYGDIALTRQVYEHHKKAYRLKRDIFRSDPRAGRELAAWRRRDNDFNYQLLNGSMKAFVPQGSIGKGLDGYQPWAKADTFFSEYALHNPSNLILSESDYSYIIGNNASYDSRQYPLAPNVKRPEGQSFCHTLVIPKARVYNVVDPLATNNRCEVIKELYSHFERFWSTAAGRRAIIDRGKKSLDDRNAALVDSPPEKGPRPPEYTEAVRKAVYADFARMEPKFLELDSKEDFVYGFHVFPDNSIGHLHLHVFPHDNSFRNNSTKDYDHHTVPIQAILEVEGESLPVAEDSFLAHVKRFWRRYVDARQPIG